MQALIFAATLAGWIADQTTSRHFIGRLRQINLVSKTKLRNIKQSNQKQKSNKNTNG